FASAAVLTIDGCLHDDSSRILICRLRDFDMNIAIIAVYTDFLDESDCNVKNLKFDTGSWRIKRAGIVLRPAVDTIYRNLFGSNIWNRNVLLVVAVFDALVQRAALAVGLRLTLSPAP